MNRKATQLAQLVSRLSMRGSVCVCICLCVFTELWGALIICWLSTWLASFTWPLMRLLPTQLRRRRRQHAACPCDQWQLNVRLGKQTAVLPGAAAAPHWLRQQKCCLLFGMLPLDMLIFTQLPSTNVYTYSTPPQISYLSLSFDIFRNLFLNYNKLLGSSW